MDSPQARSKGGPLERRRYTTDFKRKLVELTLAPEASVAAVALEHQLNANMLHKWRREFFAASRQESAPAALLPVELSPAPQRQAPAADGQLEIACARLRVRISGRVDPEMLRIVLARLEVA